MPTKEEFAKRVFGDISTIQWDFKNLEDKKKVVWWNPLDWIPEFFKVNKC